MVWCAEVWCGMSVRCSICDVAVVVSTGVWHTTQDAWVYGCMDVWISCFKVAANLQLCCPYNACLCCVQLGAIGHRGYIYSYGSRNIHGTDFYQEPTTKITFQVRGSCTARLVCNVLSALWIQSWQPWGLTFAITKNTQ